MEKTESGDRFLAALAHLAGLGLGMGVVVPAALWSEQRGRAKYLAFQLLQAYGYQSLGYTVWLILSLLILAAAFFPILIFSVDLSGPAALPIGLAVAIAEIVLTAIYMILPLWAGIACALGREFRYPVLGRRLADFLGYESAPDGIRWNEQHEQRWVAAMGHFTIAVLIWGMLAPLLLAVTQRKRSANLAFQSAQTFVFQVASLLVGLAGSIIALLAMTPLLLLGLGGNGQPEAWMLGVLIPGLCIFAFVVLVVPLLQILGQWAGLQVLRGREYRYPLIAGWVGRWAGQRERP